MSIPVNEQETVIQFNRDCDVCSIWTTDTTVMTKLDKFAESKDATEWECPKVDTIQGEVFSKEYKVNKKLISFRKGFAERVMTPEQRQAAAERLKAARSKVSNV